MPQLNWTNCEAFLARVKPLLAANVSTTDWLGFLNAAGWMENSGRYGGMGGAGHNYAGMYQVGGAQFQYMHFFTGLGKSFLNITSTAQFIADPIAQDVGAIMEFAGTPWVAGVPHFRGMFASTRIDTSLVKSVDVVSGGKVQSVKFAFTGAEFDSLVGRSFTFNYVTSSGTIVATDSCTLTQAGISAASHLLGPGQMAQILADVYYNSHLTPNNPTTVSLLENDVADGSGIAFSIYDQLLENFDVTNLVGIPSDPGQTSFSNFNQLLSQLIAQRKTRIIADLANKNEQSVMNVTSPYGDIANSVISALGLSTAQLGNVLGKIVLTGGANTTSTAQADAIYAVGTTNHTLTGGAGDDTLFAGSGSSDVLNGGQGNDSYVISGAPSSRDEIKDGDGQGLLEIGSAEISGPGQSVNAAKFGSAFLWAGDLTYVFQPIAGNIGTMTITGSELGNGSSIIIDNFDLQEAENDANGYLGIKLTGELTLAAGASVNATNNSQQPNSALQALFRTDDIGQNTDAEGNFPGGSEQYYTLSVDTPYVAAQTITIQLSGASPSDFEATVDNQLVQLSTSGAFTLILPAGQSQISFGIVDISRQDGTSDIAAGAQLQLTASFVASDAQNSDANLTSEINITYEPNGQSVAKAAKSFTSLTGVVSGSLTTYTGDGGNDYASGSTSQSVFLLKGSTDDSIVGGSGSNTIQGGTGNDVYSLFGTSDIVTLGSGHSTLSGAASGKDTIYGQSGNDLITGNGGTDLIMLANGNSQVFAGSQVNLTAAISQASTETASGKQGDLITAQDGDNTIVGGLGNDLVMAGAGHNVVVLGPGNDTFVGGIEVSDAAADWNSVNNGVHDSSGQINGVTASTSGYVDPYPQPYNGFVSPNLGLLGSGNDTIYTGNGNDDIDLGNGSNFVQLGNGADNVYGGMGDATIVAGNGADYIHGGGGSVYIQGGSGSDTIYGGDGDNTIMGGSGASTLYSAQGPTDMYPGSSLENNYVDGGAGNDLIFGSAGHDTLIAGSGNTTIQGDTGTELMYGGSGSDALAALSGSATIMAGSGANSLYGGTGANSTYVLYGGSGTDYILGGSGTNQLYAGDGGVVGHATTVDGSADSDSHTTIYGGSGVDSMFGGEGTVVIYAGDGGTVPAPNVVAAGSGSTTIYGGDGTDILQGGSGTDVIYAGDGGTDDVPTTVIAGAGTASLYGGGGSSILQDVVSGQDLITAGTSDDTVLAMGSDTIVAGSGNDVIQNQGGQLTVELNDGLGNVVMIYPGGGQDNLVFGSDFVDTDFTGNILSDTNGDTDLVLSAQGGSITVDGGLTGNLGSVSGGALAVTTTGGSPAPDANTQALLQASFGGDVYNTDSITSGDFTLGLTDGETLVGGTSQGIDTISSWGSGSSLSGSNSSSLFRNGSVIDAFGDSDVIQGSTFSTDTITAFGNGDTVTALVSTQVTLRGANDVAQAGSGSDSITASGSGDTLLGGSGNASFYVNDSSTTIVAPAAGGRDTIYSSVSYTAPDNVAALVLTGSGNLSATGGSTPMTIVGGAGNDTLSAGTGSTAATLVAGTGSTVFVINNSNDVIVDTTGAPETVVSSVGIVLPATVNELILTGSAAPTVTGNSAADTLVANTGLDTLISGSGNDLFVVGNAGDQISNAYATNSDTIQSAFSFVLPAHVDTLVLTGTANLSGTANGDADTLVSNSGVDTLTGGAGNDTFVVNNTADQLVDSSTTTHNTALSAVNFTLPANVNALTLTGTAALQATGNAAADVITANTGNDTLTALSTTAATTLIGGAGNDLFLINTAADSIQVAATNVSDTLSASVSVVAPTNVNTVVLSGTTALQATANAAGDTLVSNAGVDTLVGGAGNDVFVVNNAADVLTNVGAGDTIESSQSITVPAGAAFLVLTGSSAIKATTNSGNDEITGNAGNDTLVATTGQDTLVAGTGSATLVAGAGSDLFVVNNALDVVSLSGSHGVDTVSSSVNFTLPTNVNALLLTGSANLVGTATSGNNVVTGNAGNDTLKAGNGTDTLIAGPNATTLVGGTGSDVFEINSTADVIQNLSSTGLNTVVSSVGYTMQASVGVLSLTGTTDLLATGNANADTIIANAGNDTLVAGTGVAQFLGGQGADLIVIDNASDVVSDAYYGAKSVADTIQSSVSYTLPATVNDLVLTGSGNLVGTANQNTDVLVGNAGSDTLNGGSGNDTLIAGSGAAALVAGTGNDTFVVNSATDSVVAGAAGRHDEVDSSVSYTLPTNVNTLVLTGSTNISGSANSADDSLVAGGGADTLYAGAGNDTLVAGSAPDTLVGGAGNDVFVVNDTADSVGGASSTSNNIVRSSVGFTLPANVNTLVLTGPTAMIGQGNAGADSIIGSTGADTLVAGTGIATLTGGSGNTTFVVNNAADQVIDSYANVVNQVQSSANFVLPTNVNQLVLTGSAALSGTGNASADTLAGNTGVDTLVSGSGNDLFVVGNAGDQISNAYTTNSDTIQSALSFVLPAHVDTLVLTGSSALTGTANGDADTLVSNSGVDALTGGIGNENFVVNNTADQLLDTSTTAHNTASSSVNFTLPSDVNALTLTGTSALQGTGNSAGDVITANAGNDTLTALSTAAATTLVGGAGNDLFVVNNAADVVQVAATNSSDTLSASVSVTAPTNVNTVVLTGSAALQATANAAGDALVSNSGVDTLVGGASDNVFVVNNAADVLLNVGLGDTIQSSVPYTLTIAGGQAQLVGAAALTGTVAVNTATLVAPTGNDTLTAANEYDTLIGGSGNDTFVVNDNTDVVIDTNSAASNALQSANSATLPTNVDTLILTGANAASGIGNADESNVLTANQGNDVLHGTAMSNTIYGGSGSDTIYGGPDDNLVHAGSGGTTNAPTRVFGSSSSSDITEDVLYGDTGINVLWGGTDANTIVGGAGTQAIYAGGYSNLITAGNGGTAASPVYVYGNQNGTSAYTSSTITGGTGVDVLYGGAGSDLITAGTGGSTTVYAGTGFDTIYGAAGSLLVDTLGGSDLLVGGAGAETISGTGDDTVVAGTGVDSLWAHGGSGITYEFQPGFGTSTIGSANANGTWNSSTQSLIFGQGISSSDVAYNLVTIGNQGDAALVLSEGSSSTEVVHGLDPDVITGIAFGSNAETLAQFMNSKGATNTILSAGATYEVNTGDSQIVPIASGLTYLWAFGDDDVIDDPYSSVRIVAYGNQSTVSGGSITADGNGDTLTLTGSTGGAVLAGANDTLNTANGHYSIWVENASAVINATAPINISDSGLLPAFDSIVSSVSYTLPINIAEMSLESAIGGLSGTSNAQGGYLIAQGVNDTLWGGGAADTLAAQNSNDVLVGGSGVESYVLSNASDSIQFGSGAASLNSIQVAFSYALGASANTLLETGNYSTATGNANSDTLTASGSFDTLISGSGNSKLISLSTSPETMFGGGGNDLFVINQRADVVQESHATAVDTIQSSVSYTLPALVNNLVLTSGYATGIANSGNDQIVAPGFGDTLTAGTGADTLVGGAGPDVFAFNAGFGQDEVLNVQNGDTLQFGAGINRSNLTFSALLNGSGTEPSLVVTSNSGGSVTLQGGLAPGAISQVNFGDGTSSGIAALVAPSGSATIAGAHGNLIISAADGAVINGGTGQDTILAWGNNDTLSAGAGGSIIYSIGTSAFENGSAAADTLTALGSGSTLVGGTGSEVFVVADPSTVISVSSATGNDTVLSSTNFVLPANVANLTLTGTSALKGTGNAQSDVITANSGNDTLTAGIGLATLIGGSGSDVFVVNNTNDVVLNPSQSPSDSIVSTVNFTLPLHVDQLQINGTGLIAAGNGENDGLADNFGDRNNTLSAASGNNNLYAWGQYDVVQGGTGDDVLASESGSNTLETGTGVDTVLSENGYDNIYINNSADVIQTFHQYDTLYTSVNYTMTAYIPFAGSLEWILTGSANLVADDEAVGAPSANLDANSGNDTLIGGSSENYFVGGAGVDTFIGRGSSDTYTVTNSADVVIANATGTELVQATVNFALPEGVDTMTLISSGISGAANDAADMLSNNGNGNDTFIGGAGADTMVSGGGGNNTFVAGSGRDSLVSGGAGDVFVLNAGFGSVEASTNAASDPTVLFGSGVNPSSITARAVVDSTGNEALELDAGTSSATLDGALSGTNYQFQFGSGPVMGLAQFLAQVNVVNTTVIGGTGNIILSGASTVALATGTGSDYLYSAGAHDTLSAGSGTALIEGGGSNDVINGASGTDTLIAYGAGTTVTGGSGANILEAFGSNDTLVSGGVQANTLVGGTGVAVTFVVNNSSDSIQVQSPLGADTIESSVSFLVPGGMNLLVLTGSAALIGSANTGAETLISNSGVDTLVGIDGSDLFILNNAQDVVSVSSSHGADTIQTGFNDTLAANVSTLVLTGAGALKGTGNSIADTLRANDAGDTLVAGSGAATMIGGAGNDLFVVNNTADSIQSAVGAGVDTVSSSVSFALPSTINTLALTGSSAIKGTGNAANDLMTASTSTGKVTLVAGNATDTLISGSGIDSLVGGTGSDLFVINNASDVVSVASTTGVDTIQSSFNDTLAANVSSLVLTGSTSIAGAGNSMADTIYGNSGSDTLTAGTGLATLVGGSGNNKFVVNNAGDVVVNNYTTNSDTLSSSVTYTLPSNVNTLVLTGSAAINGTGNSANDMLTASTSTGAATLTAGAGTGADTLVAGSGADVLVSNSGVDSLTGGAGNDLFVLSNSADVVTVGATHGTDSLQAGFNDTLAANVSVLVLTGSASLTGTGNSIADVLLANSGNDTLTAGSGVATLIGGAGNDVFVLNNTADTVQSASTTAIDTIRSSVSFTLPTNVNTLELTGSGSLKGTGNAANDLLTASGTTTADTLVAGNGADTLISGTGTDSLVGGTGADLFVVNATADVVNVGATHGADTIQSSVSYTLPANVQYLSLTGSGALTGTASSSSVSLVQGGTGADTLNGGTALSVLEAGTAGAQVLKATGAQAALIGGGAADTLTGGAFKDFLAAGKVADTITGGATHNVVAVNSGDGATVLAPATGAGNVLSLGAGIDTEALKFTKSGNNLVLNDGVAGDSITFTNWFAASADQTTTTLQVIESASASYSSAGTDALRNKPIEEFNFTALVAAFTAAGSTSGWSLSNAMGADTLASSATAAYGGDLAYYFGENGNLTGMNLSAAQSTLTNASYGTATQSIDSWASISGTGTTLNAIVASPSSDSGTNSTLATDTDRKSIQPVTLENSSDSGRTLVPQSLQGPVLVTPDVLARLAGDHRVVWPDRARVQANIGNAWDAMHAQLDTAVLASTASAGVEAVQHEEVPDLAALMGSGAVGTRLGRHDRTSQTRRLQA